MSYAIRELERRLEEAEKRAEMLAEAAKPQPYFQGGGQTLFCGDSLAVLRGLPDASIDAIVTDPPYSSGGMMRADRTRKTSDKYVLAGTKTVRPEFLEITETNGPLFCGAPFG